MRWAGAGGRLGGAEEAAEVLSTAARAGSLNWIHTRRETHGFVALFVVCCLGKTTMIATHMCFFGSGVFLVPIKTVVCLCLR